MNVTFPGNGTVEVRDSKTPDLPPLVFTEEEWQPFVLGVQLGEFHFLPTDRRRSERDAG